MNTPAPLVTDPNRIRLAMLGMVPGNGHPFSWSAIVNGRYDREKMANCGYAGIPAYLNAQPDTALGLHGIEVTHVWCDDPEDTRRVAEASLIEHQLERPEDAIDQVDAVVIATDIGHEHVARAKPFVDAGIPVFIDKPLTDNEADLKQFCQWVDQNKPFLSTSCMHYAREFIDLRDRFDEVGELSAVTVTMAKSWERYGIHALESVYHLLEPGKWLDVTNTGSSERNVVHARHANGTDVLLLVSESLVAAFGHVSVMGRNGRLDARFVDTFSAFKSQLEAFATYLRTGQRPVPWSETVELMKLVIAGSRSREQQGRRVPLSEICHEL